LKGYAGKAGATVKSLLLNAAMEMEKIHEAIIDDLKDIVKGVIDEAFEQERKKQKKGK